MIPLEVLEGLSRVVRAVSSFSAFQTPSPWAPLCFFSLALGIETGWEPAPQGDFTLPVWSSVMEPISLPAWQILPPSKSLHQRMPPRTAHLEVAFPIPAPAHPLPGRTCPAQMSPEDDSSSSRLMKPRWSQEGRAGAEHLLALEKLPGPWKTRRLLSTTSSPLREPARRAAWRCRHVTMHTALWRTRSLLLPPLSEAWAAPRSPTQPPSPFVYALTQSRCVSSCLVFINVLRAQRSRSHGASSHIHPSRTLLAPVGLKGAGQLGPLFSSFLYFILLLLLFFF